MYTKSNPLQFAVVREDPALEINLIKEYGAKNILLIGSGGCSALTLKAEYPDIALTLIDMNPAQLHHIQKKFEVLSQKNSEYDKDLFNVNSSSPEGLTQNGNFESLFRGLKNFINEFIATEEEWLAFFQQQQDTSFLNEVFTHKYWPVAFDLFLSDALLLAMFGPDAIQNKGEVSYPRYFQTLLEKGLREERAPHNYFLHHIFLGQYLDTAKPDYLTGDSISLSNVTYLKATFQEIPSFEAFDLIQFSNIFDWMSVDEVNTILAHVLKTARKGTVLLWRQLNNDRNYESIFNDKIQINKDLSTEYKRIDRSLFYNKISVGIVHAHEI